MIVTRSWLEEYIDLSSVSNDELSRRLNEIGLEVDSLIEHKIPSKVVVGEIKSCSKHPDADKLNVCQIDVGEDELVQIVCGASNVVNARYVAVATVGSVLPGDFKIKKAKLRGVESYGMVCSSSELGLPEVEDGIMILDDSIGELQVGEELKSYPKFADTVIDIELTANRGDCLSIYGVARDLAAAFKKELKSFEDNSSCKELDASVEVELKDGFDGALEFALADIDEYRVNFLTKLRLAFVENDAKSDIDKILAYATHASGVILRAYNRDKVSSKIEVVKSSDYVVEVKSDNKSLSIVGVSADDEFSADDAKNIIVEASYIDPDFVAEGVISNKLKSDSLYYNSFRGSEPDLDFGMAHIKKALCSNADAAFSKNCVKVGKEFEDKTIEVSADEINAIIGQEIAVDEIVEILENLGFKVEAKEKLKIAVPRYRHDIKNRFDIAEEVLRIYGIDNIAAKPLYFKEENRINATYIKFRDKQLLSQRAVAAGFFEAMTYIFASKEQQEKYGFKTIDESLELVNPIVNELNTLRVTMFTNLLNAVSQNIKYGKKSIPLFEVGVVFNSKREERDVLSFVYSGELNRASIKNGAKAKMIDFGSFVDKISSVIGEFKLKQCDAKNDLMHPYQSAEVIKNEEVVGFVSKLHPKAAKDFDVADTFICELELDKILPKHKNATELSNYQPATKDLSIVVDKSLNFFDVAKVLNDLKEKLELFKDFYPLDIYSDEKLGDKKSLTIRFTLQSDQKTLSDEDIDSNMSEILEQLKSSFNAELR